MKQTILNKVLATMLIVTLTFANILLLGVNVSETYATSENLEKQSIQTNNENVEFDAYFKDETGKNMHTKKEDINSQELKIYILVSVKKGYLKNATIQVLGENNTQSNLKLKSSNEGLEYIEGIDESNNIIKLKQVNSGTQIVLEIPVVALKEENYDLSNFSKLNNIILTGTYVRDNAKEMKIEKIIQTRNEWIATANVKLEQELIKYIPYQLETEIGTILQTKVISGIENNILPVQESKIEITVPQVNGKKPIDANISINGKLASNGINNEQLEQESWNYDMNAGKITIDVKNEARDGKVVWLKGQDEYIVTYVYEDKMENISTSQLAKLEVKAYNIESKFTKENCLEITPEGTIGQVVEIKNETTEQISKGYLYTKVDKETSYEEKIIVDLSNTKLVDEILIEQNMDYFISEAGQAEPTTISNVNYAYYKETKINKANLEKILGKNGTIKIRTMEGNELATIDNKTQIDENGNYIIEYEQENNQIIIQTSKPVAIGKLEIYHTKCLKAKTDYNTEQIASFTKLKVSAAVIAKLGEKTIAHNQSSKEITLVAPTTKVEAQVSNTKLSTIVTNENVELRVILKTNDISCELYKNPSIKIVLPNYIKKLKIKDVNLLFDNELKIKNSKSYVNENGNIVIQIDLEGEQTVYSQDKISKGANLIINTDITIKETTPNKKSAMQVYVTNENAINYEIPMTKVRSVRTATAQPIEQVAVDIEVIGPIGVVTTNELLEYNSENDNVISRGTVENIGNLEVGKKEKIAKAQMKIIQNSQNQIGNVSILGRIPTQGNKNAYTKEDLNSNIESKLATPITITGKNIDDEDIDMSKASIYYSINSDATKDLMLEENGWTKEISNYENIKSYLVVMDENIDVGSSLTLNYGFRIPENLEYKKQVFSNYVVYFDSIKENETVSEKVVTPLVGLTTGYGPSLDVKISADIEDGKDIEQGKVVTYIVTVSNNGSEDLENVTISGNVPENTIFISVDDSGTEPIKEYDSSVKIYSELIDKIKQGETKTISYQVEIRGDKDEEVIARWKR